MVRHSRGGDVRYQRIDFDDDDDDEQRNLARELGPPAKTPARNCSRILSSIVIVTVVLGTVGAVGTVFFYGAVLFPLPGGNGNGTAVVNGTDLDESGLLAGNVTQPVNGTAVGGEEEGDAGDSGPDGGGVIDGQEAQLSVGEGDSVQAEEARKTTVSVKSDDAGSAPAQPPAKIVGTNAKEKPEDDAYNGEIDEDVWSEWWSPDVSTTTTTTSTTTEESWWRDGQGDESAGASSAKDKADEQVRMEGLDEAEPSPGGQEVEKSVDAGVDVSDDAEAEVSDGVSGETPAMEGDGIASFLLSRDDFVGVAVVVGVTTFSLLLALCCICRLVRRRRRAKKQHFSRLIKDLNATEKFSIDNPSDEDASEEE